ncbi:MAG: IclR family transcriptional regulator, partial [Pararhizobium sp.]
MDGHGGRTRGRPRSFNNTSEGTLVQALDRAMGTLKVVAGGNGLSLTEIAEATDQAPATAYRALLTMQKHGVVEFDAGAQLWRIGVEAFRIGSAFLGRSSIVEQARPKMQEIMATTGETANLAIVDRGEVIFVSQVETHEPIRAFFRPGTRGPVHASG